MSPICGILSRNGKGVSADLHSMMSTLHHEHMSEEWIASNGTLERWEGHNGAKGEQALGQISFAAREQPTERPAVSLNGSLAVLYEGNLFNREELGSGLNLSSKSSDASATEVVAYLLENCYRGDLISAVRQVAPKLDGEYCLAASDGRQTVVLRDPVGLRPLFYAGNEGYIMAFASRKTPLWKLGLDDVRPLRAGMLASLEKDGIQIHQGHPLDVMGIEATVDDLTAVVDSYCARLRIAVEKRLRNLKRVGVLISGGVDSCLLGKLVSDIAARRGIEVTAYTAGVYEADDLLYADDFARELGLRHRVRILNPDEVKSYIDRVALAVEERDMVQIEAGIGIYAALEMASKDGMGVIFSGQGPDELWGGYTWYPQVIARDGYRGLEQRMRDDLAQADIETLDRENKIALAHGVEQAFPYADLEVVKLAMSVSPRIKITSAHDRVGKHPHREAAKKLGLPARYADRGKNAAQHGTGTHDILLALAVQGRFTPDLVARARYHAKEVSEEVLSSSSRYGYLYAEKDLWQTPEHVQFFLDSVAYRNNLLGGDERARIEGFLVKAGVAE